MSTWDKDEIAKYKAEKRNRVPEKDQSKGKRSKKKKKDRNWVVKGSHPWMRDGHIWYRGLSEEHCENWIRKYAFLSKSPFEIVCLDPDESQP